MLKDLGGVLIAGAGPAAIQIAVSLGNSRLCRKIGIVNRISYRTQRLLNELDEKQSEVAVDVPLPGLTKFAGKVCLNNFFCGYQTITGGWETLILCIPSGSYLSVINQIPQSTLGQLKAILLISPGIGSNYLVASILSNQKNRPEIISLSTYIGDSKFSNEETSLTQVTTKAIKRRIYIASNHKSGNYLPIAVDFFESLGLQCTRLSDPMEAESRSITTYVHPPFLMSNFALDVVFHKIKEKKFTYKLFPEGPITPATIRDMIYAWKEISSLLSSLSLPPFNLLKFLNDDNYPVREESLSRYDIEKFGEFEQIKQEYLLYIRYASLLIDPFSEPNPDGRYLEFSFTPFRLSYQDENGKWIVPRIPTEDYKRMKLIKGIAAHRRVSMPTIEKLISNYESKSRAFMIEKGPENMADNLDYEEAEELALICDQIDSRQSAPVI